MQTGELPPIDFWSQTKDFFNRVYDNVMGVRPFAKLEPYFEAGDNGRVYHEVNAALQGDIASAQRVNDQNKLVLSVAAPVQRFKAIYGVAGRHHRRRRYRRRAARGATALIGLFVVAIAVMLVSSVLLSRIHRAPGSGARRCSGSRARRPLGPRDASRTWKSATTRSASLATSFSAMTRALYDRIDAIESFAADVAHEIKNPLTSLKSAVEMLTRAKDDVSREKMMAIVRNDVKRIDRLITDISDASRLDAELSREVQRAGRYQASARSHRRGLRLHGYVAPRSDGSGARSAERRRWSSAATSGWARSSAI